MKGDFIIDTLTEFICLLGRFKNLFIYRVSMETADARQ